MTEKKKKPIETIGENGKKYSHFMTIVEREIKRISRLQKERGIKPIVTMTDFRNWIGHHATGNSIKKGVVTFRLSTMA